MLYGRYNKTDCLYVEFKLAMTLTTEYLQVNTIKSVACSPVKYHVLLDVASSYRLDNRQKEALFGIPLRTQARYKKDDSVLSPLVVDRLERFNRITQQAIALFEDEAETKIWLSTPKVSLDNQTPLEAMITDAGAKKVEQILYRAEYGVYG